MIYSLRKIITVILLVCALSLTYAADLPKKGIKPKDIYGAPGPLPPGPGAPVGSGVGVILILSTLYGLKKYKEEKRN